MYVLSKTTSSHSCPIPRNQTATFPLRIFIFYHINSHVLHVQLSTIYPKLFYHYLPHFSIFGKPIFTVLLTSLPFYLKALKTVLVVLFEKKKFKLDFNSFNI